MTSAEKILDGIADEAAATAEQKIREAQDEAQAILNRAGSDADRERAAILAENERAVATLASTGKSGAALILRDAALAAKREEIDRTLRQAAETLRALPDDEYDAFLIDVIRAAGCTDGILLLPESDSNRRHEKLNDYLKTAGITLSNEKADLPDGFLLKNGDIEINASFEALIHEKHAELVDKIHRILFTDEKG